MRQKPKWWKPYVYGSYLGSGWEWWVDPGIDEPLRKFDTWREAYEYAIRQV